ncbi:pirin family protein [Pseudarthrobacter sp. J1763]|uniref:pirin family protein n=1 Tax=Pseudarthrobacter sp. J1763 TaxID=3420445 RepID=UPI003D2B6A0D
MTNLEVVPQPEVCPAAPADQNSPCVQLWPEREVPLGGVRAINVSRTLPQRGLPTVGAWCFLDSFGPARTLMSVLPHPHIGLQTVTWPLTGEIRHRDSLGNDVIVRPGELNIMTAGHGISHSEFSLVNGEVSASALSATPDNSVADGGTDVPLSRGLQLWVALPDGDRHRAPSFEQHQDLPVVSGEGFAATVMVGSFAGATSPAKMYSPIVGAVITLDSATTLPVNPQFEHALLVIEGSVTVDDVRVQPGPLAYLGAGRSELRVIAETGTKVLLLGGEPFREDLLMWWNFVGRTHEEIEQARQDWEATDVLYTEDSLTTSRARYGVVPGHGPSAGVEAGRIPAPALPSVKLRPRKRG